jgi:hypothetical protein
MRFRSIHRRRWTNAGTVLKMHALFKEGDFSEHSFGVAAHLSFRDEEQRKSATKTMEDLERQIEFVGKLVYVTPPGWPESIRLEVDRSIFFPPGLFMSWNSKWRGPVDLKTLGDILESLAATAKRLDFDIAIP